MSVNPGFEAQQLGWKVLSQQALPWIGLWLLLVIVALFVRPLGSVDELKLLAVTWEMWQQGNFLLPVFNGFDAPEQPPLMPWFIHIGWTVFGVNDWWPRVLSALFSLMSLFIIGRISALLWMDQLKMPRYTAFILLGSGLWVFYLTVSLADNMLTFFTLLGLYGILRAWRYTTRVGWLIFGFATGCAVLSNGLMSLLYTLPVALLGPIWAGREHALRWTNWYIDMSTGLLVGLGLVGLWGLLIVIQVEQGTAIAIDHVIGALPPEISLFPKNQPTYSYLYFLPAALLPWMAWPLIYSRIWQVKDKSVALGLIFCLVWVVPVLMVLSVLGPRQPQFLLPLLPAFALLIANLLFNEELIDHGEQRFSMSLLLPTLLLGISLAVAPMLASETWVPQPLKELSPVIGLSITAFVLLVIVLPASGFAGRIFFIFSGVLLALIPTFPRIEQLPTVLWDLPIYVGIGVALFGVALTWLPTFTLDQRIIRNAIFSMVTVTGLMTWMNFHESSIAGIRSSANYIATLDQRNIPVAHIGEYQGEYHFYGRLTQPITSVTPETLGEWVAKNPRGVVITYTNAWQPNVAKSRAVYSAPYYGSELRAWKASDLAGI